MKTDQLGDRLWISAKLTWLKFRWQTLRLVQLVGFAMLLGGAFLYFRRFVDDLAGVGPALAKLPDVYLVQDVLGNVLLIALGIIVVAAAVRTS